MSAEVLLQGLVAADRYPRPQWEDIAARVTAAGPVDEDAVWTNIAKKWMERHCAAAGDKYWCTASTHFLLASALSKREAANLLQFAERARRGISHALRGVAASDGLGPHVVMVFDTEDEYYEYIAPFYREGGHYAMSAGVHLNAGYGHFALPRREPDELESVVAHELTHALVAHLPLPRWLNEGMAVNLESALCPRSGRRVELSWMDRHRQWWDAETVQQYWSGEVFYRPDRFSELAYELAWIKVRALADDYDVFRAFACEATAADAGQAAAKKYYGGGLGLHFEALLGEGQWDPDPQLWKPA